MLRRRKSRRLEQQRRREQEKAEQEDAAIKIQSFHRGRRTRYESRRRNDAARMIQAQQRRKNQQLKYKVDRQQAREDKIRAEALLDAQQAKAKARRRRQKSGRSRSSDQKSPRKKTGKRQQRDAAASKIQARYRGKHAREKIYKRKSNEAATKIQSTVRRRHARRRTAQLQMERQNNVASDEGVEMIQEESIQRRTRRREKRKKRKAKQKARQNKRQPEGTTGRVRVSNRDRDDNSPTAANRARAQQKKRSSLANHSVKSRKFMLRRQSNWLDHMESGKQTSLNLDTPAPLLAYTSSYARAGAAPLYVVPSAGIMDPRSLPAVPSSIAVPGMHWSHAYGPIPVHFATGTIQSLERHRVQSKAPTNTGATNIAADGGEEGTDSSWEAVWQQQWIQWLNWQNQQAEDGRYQVQAQHTHHAARYGANDFAPVGSNGQLRSPRATNNASVSYVPPQAERMGQRRGVPQRRKHHSDFPQAESPTFAPRRQAEGQGSSRRTERNVTSARFRQQRKINQRYQSNRNRRASPRNSPRVKRKQKRPPHLRPQPGNEATKGTEWMSWWDSHEEQWKEPTKPWLQQQNWSPTARRQHQYQYQHQHQHQHQRSLSRRPQQEPPPPQQSWQSQQPQQQWQQPQWQGHVPQLQKPVNNTNQGAYYQTRRPPPLKTNGYDGPSTIRSPRVSQRMGMQQSPQKGRKVASQFRSPASLPVSPRGRQAVRPQWGRRSPRKTTRLGKPKQATQTHRSPLSKRKTIRQRKRDQFPDEAALMLLRSIGPE